MSEPQPKRSELARSSHDADAERDAAADFSYDPGVTAEADEDRAPLAQGQGEPAAGGAITVTVSGRTDVGLVREHNEDNYVVADLATGEREPAGLHRVSPVGLLLGVCDGMGGAAAGEVASQMAVDTILEIMQQSVPAPDRDALARALVRSIETAGKRIFEEARTDRSRRGMGTTSTIATLMDRTLFVGQVGDSRAYILRAGELKQLTKDQSLVNQLIEAGQLTEDEAEAFEHSNIILQALGTTEHVSVDLTFMELRRGDRLLMCSDGLSGLVHGDVIREVLIEYQDLQSCCERLIELAKAGGGHDNVTVILAEFGGDGLAPPQSGDLIGYQQYPLPLDSDQTDGERGSTPSLPPAAGAPVLSRISRETLFDGDSSASKLPLRYLALAVLGALVTGSIYLLTCTRTKVAEEQVVGIEAVPVAPPPAPEDVEVVVRSDAEASELLVDGEPQGPAVGGRWVLALSPGPHKLEARAGGISITSTVVDVHPGEPATVFLSIPDGEDFGDSEANPSAPKAAAKGTSDEGRVAGSEAEPVTEPPRKRRKRAVQKVVPGPAQPARDGVVEAPPEEGTVPKPPSGSPGSPNGKPKSPAGGVAAQPGSDTTGSGTSRSKPKAQGGSDSLSAPPTRRADEPAASD